MPAEHAPHERTLMAWPARTELWEQHFEQAKADYAEIANAIAAFEPVLMVADPSQAADARAACGEGVEVAEIAIDDSWMRDSGPIFVLDGTGRRAGVDFGFNAWGEKFTPYADDAELAALLEQEVPFYFPRWGEEEQAVARRLIGDRFNADALRHFNEQIAANMDLRPGLARVTAPSLAITGELDPFGESAAREIADALPNATLVVLPGAGHFIFGESANRNAWARAILDFLAGD